MFERIEQLKQQVQDDLAKIKTSEALEQFRLKYLAGSGAVKKLMGTLKEIPADQKREFGRLANELKGRVESAYEALKGDLGPAPGSAGTLSGGGEDDLDLTEPGLPARMGRTHVITQTMDDLVEVFGRMGFDVATGPEVEDEWHNFIALNIPEEHPARDPLDNFYLLGVERALVAQSIAPAAPGSDSGGAGVPPASAPGPNSGGAGVPPAAGVVPGACAANTRYMLRSQTSTIQIRVMEKTQPPVRVVALGRVYRPDEHDATHFSMFHQIEGLYVDRRVSLVDLKTTLLQFAHAYFGPETEVRLRPSFFPFTEPSAEMDVKINLKGQWRWMELGGCGMVDPNVLAAVGYDPEKWSGFAFGLGIERIAMRKYDIQDIRWLFENDARFLRQF